MLVLGVVAAVLSGGNLLVLGLAGLLILFGVVVAAVAEVAGWLQAHGIFRPPKTYGGLTYTQRGEVVRSNSERTIADYFHRNNIRYVYEQDAMNIKFISIYPNNMGNLDWVFRAKFREVAGYDLPTRSEGVPSSYCVRCGTHLGPSSAFCQSCGVRIGA